MKKLSEKRKRWSKKKSLDGNLYKRQIRPRSIRHLKPPPILSFSRSGEETQKFLVRLRQAVDLVRLQNIKLYVDFSPIKYIGPAAALCLLAEFDRWQRVGRRKLHAVQVDRWNIHVRRLLQDLGFFDVLRTAVRPSPVEPGPDADRWIKFRSGDQADGSEIVGLRDDLEKLSWPLRHRLRVYDGLSEALTNVVNHAYPVVPGLPDDPALGRRWWLSGSVEQGRSRARMMVLDLGITIPRSLPGTDVWSRIERVLPFLHRVMPTSEDAKLLVAAFMVGRTRTGRRYRGRGLGEILRVAGAHRTNRVRIISGRGMVQWTLEGGFRGEELPFPFLGTLIEWDLGVVPNQHGQGELPLE